MTAEATASLPDVTTELDSAPTATRPPTTYLAPPRALAKPSPEELPHGTIARLELLARDPDGFLACLTRVESSPDAAVTLTSLTRSLVGALVVGAGLFGTVIGAHRSALQAFYCTLKVPLILLITLVVCAPPFITLARVGGLPLGARHVIALALSSCARFALVLVGLAPFVWLMEGWSLGYHRVILSVVAVCIAAGVAAGRLLFSGLARAGTSGTRVGLAFVALFGLVGAQTSWILRPYVVRPRTEHAPFVRALEGDFFDALRTTARSSIVYGRQRCEEGVCD